MDKITPSFTYNEGCIPSAIYSKWLKKVSQLFYNQSFLIRHQLGGELEMPKYSLTNGETAFIEKTIKPME